MESVLVRILVGPFDYKQKYSVTSEELDSTSTGLVTPYGAWIFHDRGVSKKFLLSIVSNPFTGKYGKVSNDTMIVMVGYNLFSILILINEINIFYFHVFYNFTFIL